VVERSLFAVLDVDAVASHVPRRQIGAAEAVASYPVEGVLEEVMCGHVEDGDAVCAHDDPVLPTVGSVEHDRVPVHAPNRDVVFCGRHDVAARIAAGGEHNRVARHRARDRQL
jgi:hypothetical protein